MERSYNAGEIIFREGEDSDSAYQLLSGKVEIFKRGKGGTVLLSTLGEGELFGEMGIISNRPHSASASAVTDVKLRVLSREYLGELLSRQPEEITLLIRVLMERLRESSQQLSEVMSLYKDKFDIRQFGSPPPVKRVTLLPLTEELKTQMSAQGLVISSFPFRVGSVPEGMQLNPLDWNNLFVTNADPNVMSRNHFAIQPGEKGLMVSDRGSKTGTIVNNTKVGGGAEITKLDLVPGENMIIAGNENSPYRFSLIWE